MRKHKRIQSHFVWVPIHERISAYCRPDHRIPKYWLYRSGADLFFINNSSESLEFVTTETGGFQTCDDEVLTIESSGYRYENVLPGEAVKIEEFDDYYDLDYVFQIELCLKSKSEGVCIFKSPPHKGSIGETVLLWDSGETGKYVVFTKK